MSTMIKSSRVREGDEVAIGSTAYKIVDVSEGQVTARMIVKYGQQIFSDLSVVIDLRLPGWEYLERKTT